MHITLLGDSVLDNKAYVGSEPDVSNQLRAIAPSEWRVSLLAADGAITSSVLNLFKGLPSDATHLVVSAGGNDALGEAGILDADARSAAEVLSKLADIQDRFRTSYAAMLDAAARFGLPTAVCTIYDPRYPDPVRHRLSALALSIVNDVISRQAFSRRLSLIDMRIIFSEDADFANPVEPSVAGGLKLARAIYRFAVDQEQVVI